jgi:hypothetical protein
MVNDEIDKNKYSIKKRIKKFKFTRQACNLGHAPN